MAYQDLSKEPGKVSCVAKLTGWDILGIPVKAPLAKYPVVYTLPMLTISPTKGTGLVTSVPSDAPDDYINLEEFKRKPAFREKYHIKDEMVTRACEFGAPEPLLQIMPYEIVPIINIPELGNLAAEAACKALKIKSPNDSALLATAKEDVYQKGFYAGTMLVGEHKGKPVKYAKPLIKDKLVASGEAVIYSEPTSQVGPPR